MGRPATRLNLRLVNSVEQRAANDRRSQFNDASGPEKSNPTLIDRLRSRQSLLDSKEVIDLLGVHITTLQLWTRKGRIPFLRVGHLIRFDPGQLASWLKARQTQP
jgi:excisionase family DNA binding protein